MMRWRKSSKCNGPSACVEVALLSDGRVALRDGKEQDGPVLVFTPGEFAAFLAGVRAGEFDLAALAESAGDRSDAHSAARACGASGTREEASPVSL
jgi:hypothetical protein